LAGSWLLHPHREQLLPEQLKAEDFQMLAHHFNASNCYLRTSCASAGTCSQCITW
jgi:hypothetical protein